MKKVVGVIFGGRTCEHDVSIITAHQLLENADRAAYELVPIYIAQNGKWYVGDALWDVKFFEAFDAEKVTEVYFEPADGDHNLYPVKLKAGFLGAKERKPLCHLDVVIPAMHGMNGEDGTLQGLLELANIPYTSVGVMGSAVGMDKIAMHLLFRGAGLPVLEFSYTERSQWRKDRKAVLDEMEAQLPYPMFVKPCNLGSSIGIRKATDRKSLQEAMEVAFSFDRRVLVERGLDCIEVNCSAMGFGGEIEVSMVEQPVSGDELLDFDTKYLQGGKNSKGMKSLSRLLPAPISPEMTERVQELTEVAYRALDCKGVIRLDMMIEKGTNKLYVNEINTIPGSFAYYLWEPLGIRFSQLIDRMIAQAEAAHREKNLNNYAFDSPILYKYSGGAKGTK